MLADQHLPRYDAHDAQFAIVHAPAKATYRAIQETRLTDDRLLDQLPRLTSLLDTDPPEPETLGQLIDALPIFRLDEEPPHELVLGAIANLRNPAKPLRTDIPQERFSTFHEPHHAKLTFSISAHPRGDDTTILSMETRARATRPQGRTQLAWTMRLTKPPRSLIANRILSAIRDHAEGKAPKQEPLDLDAATGQIPTLDDTDPNERFTLLRVDINSPLTDGNIRNHARLRHAARTLQTLQEKDARIAVIAHQGRPGSDDFIRLEEHAQILDEHTPAPVHYAPHIDDEEALEAFQNTAPGEATVLENVRFAEGETDDVTPQEHAQRGWVQRLAKQGELYVNDAFPVAHRPHASITAFPEHLPSVAGPLLARELDVLDGIEGKPEPRVMALGGAKIKTSLDVAAHQLSNGHLDKLLVGGLLGSLFLEADGIDTGQGTRSILEEQAAEELLPKARSTLEGNEERLVLPSDVAVREGEKRLEVPVSDLPANGSAMDIGSRTSNRFADEIAHAGTVLVHGPMGVYEEPMFSRGTAQVLAAAAKGEAYSVVGGGHTVGALEESGVDPDAFDHVSLAGGALLAHLAGNKLPGVEALRVRRG